MILSKKISSSGFCSRREAERYVRAGQVQVDGTTVDHPAFQVGEAAVISVDGHLIPAPEQAALWMFHKPRGCLTTRHDPQERSTIYDFLPAAFQQRHTIGRLDYDSEGLLLMTNNGALKREFELPSTALHRVYRVRMRNTPTAQTLKALSQGVEIEGMRYRPVKAVVQSETRGNSWLEVTLVEGKNREIRRIFEHFRHPVSRLIRVAYGDYKLGDLASAKWQKIPYAAPVLTQ